MTTAALRMDGRVCLVTGASSGIGKETALALARMGATVIVHGHDPERSAAAAEAVRRASPQGAVELVVADLSSQAEVRRLAAAVLQRYDSLHVLVNNAGVLRMRRTLTVDGLELTFALNHLAYFLLTRLLLDRLGEGAGARAALEEAERLLEPLAAESRDWRYLDEWARVLVLLGKRDAGERVVDELISFGYRRPSFDAFLDQHNLRPKSRDGTL